MRMRRLLYIMLILTEMGPYAAIASDCGGACADTPQVAVQVSEGQSFGLSEMMLISGVRTYVAQRLSVKESELKVKLTNMPSLGGFILPEDILEVKEGGQGGLLGRSSFLVSIRRGIKTVASQWITAEVLVRQEVVLAAASLKRHHLIHRNDLALQAVYLSRPIEFYAATPEALVGKRMIRSVDQGAPISMDIVEEAPLIYKGDRVSLLINEDGFSISTMGLAKEDGFPGQQIAVMNLDSKKVVYGNVQDAATVKITLR